MQGQIIETPHNGTGARPASGSAFLAGHVVTVTVPAMTMSIGLLAAEDTGRGMWDAGRGTWDASQMDGVCEVPHPLALSS